MAGFGAAPDSAPQLVQLRQPEAFWILDDHQGCVGNVHTDLDDGRCDEQLALVVVERRHHLGLLFALHTSVQQADVDAGQLRLEGLPGGFGRLGVQFVGVFDERANPVGLLLSP